MLRVEAVADADQSVAEAFDEALGAGSTGPEPLDGGGSGGVVFGGGAGGHRLRALKKNGQVN